MLQLAYVRLMDSVRVAMLAPFALLAACTDPGSVDVGDTMPALAWEGYVNAEGIERSSTLPFGDYGIDALKASGRGYALLHTAEAF